MCLITVYNFLITSKSTRIIRNKKIKKFQIEIARATTELSTVGTSIRAECKRTEGALGVEKKGWG